MHMAIISVLSMILTSGKVRSADHCGPDTHFGPPKEDQEFAFTSPSSQLLSSVNSDSTDSCMSTCCHTDKCNIISFNQSSSITDEKNCFLYSCLPLKDCTFQNAVDIFSFVLITDEVITKVTVPLEIDTTEGPPGDPEIISERIVDVINDTDVDLNSFNGETIDPNWISTSQSSKLSSLPSTKTTNVIKTSSLLPSTSSSSSSSSTLQSQPASTVKDKNSVTLTSQQVPSTSKTISSSQDLNNDTLQSTLEQILNTTSTSQPLQSNGPASNISTSSTSDSLSSTKTASTTVHNADSTVVNGNLVTKPIVQNVTNLAVQTTNQNSNKNDNQVSQPTTNEVGMSTKTEISNKTTANTSSNTVIPTTKTNLVPNSNITEGEITTSTTTTSTTTTTTSQHPTTIETTEHVQSQQTTKSQVTTESQANPIRVTTESSLTETNETAKPLDTIEFGETVLVNMQKQTVSPDQSFATEIGQDIIEVTSSSASADISLFNKVNSTLNTSIETGIQYKDSVTIDQLPAVNENTEVPETVFNEEITVQNNTIYFGSINITFADSKQLLEEEKESHFLSAALIAALSFGILFFFAVLVLIGKRCFDSWQRRHYSRVDYLVNGMYN